ncbi:MAG: hypothetical protein Q4D06_00790 [Coriobacteriia bacterium]|nr:hypothetical protein [Coriobacteriia bacterium]
MASFKGFLLQRLPELLFLTVASSALFSTLTFGFHVDDAVRANYALIVGWSFVLALALTLASYSPRTVVAGGVGYAVAGMGAVFAASAMSGHSPFDEVYGNLGSVLLLGFVCATLTYLLTRRRGTAVLYVVLGAFTCVLIQFLYGNGLLVRFVIFLVAALALLVRSSQQAAGKTLAQGAVSRLSALAVGAGLCLAAAVLSLGVWFVVVAPLNPPALELKLITRYYALEEVRVSGFEQYEHKINEQLKTDREKDGDRQTNKENSNEKDDGNAKDQGSQGFQLTGFDDPAGAVRYWVESPWWPLVVLGVILLVVLVIAAKKALRARRFKRMRALPADDQVKAFYFFFQKRFQKLGLVKEPASSPYAYACDNATAYAPFEAGAGGATYKELAHMYCDVVYGQHLPSESELQVCADLYGVFYKNVCAYVGKPKYALTLFFRL